MMPSQRWMNCPSGKVCKISIFHLVASQFTHYFMKLILMIASVQSQRSKSGAAHQISERCLLFFCSTVVNHGWLSFLSKLAMSCACLEKHSDLLTFSLLVVILPWFKASVEYK